MSEPACGAIREMPYFGTKTCTQASGHPGLHSDGVVEWPVTTPVSVPSSPTGVERVMSALQNLRETVATVTVDNDIFERRVLAVLHKHAGVLGILRDGRAVEMVRDEDDKVREARWDEIAERRETPEGCRYAPRDPLTEQERLPPATMEDALSRRHERVVNPSRNWCQVCGRPLNAWIHGPAEVMPWATPPESTAALPAHHGPSPPSPPVPSSGSRVAVPG